MVDRWHHGGGGGSGWGYGLAALLLLGLVVVIVLVAVLLYRQLGGRDRARHPVGPAGQPWPGGAAVPGGPPDARPAPEQLLAERYALGEIDDEEYRRRLAVLRHPG
ncbi:SHOCT domain-containing protein [Kitasatospora sp. NPDC094015]|uniref:SHOCT domain-containing protein n=1 Tax=Kitasatospora sp. NPDC094015 TaxID=3155205 RepID=UPI0033338007